MYIPSQKTNKKTQSIANVQRIYARDNLLGFFIFVYLFNLKDVFVFCETAVSLLLKDL